MKTRLELGNWNVVCDVCGFRFKNTELRDRWDGKKVCSKDFETRHTMDLYKARTENPGVPWTRKEPTDTFVTVTYAASNVGTQDNTIPSGTFNSTTL